MYEREAVRGGADGLQSIQLRRKQVRCALETADDCGSCGCHRGPLVGAAPAHVHAGAVLRGAHHARGGGCDRRIIVQHAQHQRLQQRALAERALDLQNRRIREEHLTLAVTLDRTGEMQVLQPRNRLLANHLAVGQETQVLVAEEKPTQLIQNAADARHDAVTAAFGQVARIHLEHAFAVRRAILQAGVQHRVLIHIRHQCR